MKRDCYNFKFLESSHNLSDKWITFILYKVGELERNSKAPKMLHHEMSTITGKKVHTKPGLRQINQDAKKFFGLTEVLWLIQPMVSIHCSININLHLRIIRAKAMKLGTEKALRMVIEKKIIFEHY